MTEAAQVGLSARAAASFRADHRGNAEAAKLESYPHLDWLRFILATIVFLAHARVPLPGPIDGFLAVAVFLALSGWLIGGILMRSERTDLPRFFYNRATRIWAPFFASVVLLYLFAAVREGISQNWFKYLFYDVTFTHITWTHFPRAGLEMPLKGTGNHFWSISVEEQFYLAAPLLMLFFRWGKQPALWAVVTAYLMATQSIFAPIGAGVFAAAIHARRPIGGIAAERWAAGAGAVVLLALMWWWRDQAITSLFAVLTVIALTAPGRRGGQGLFVGAISYPFYLNHWIGLFATSTMVKHVRSVPFAISAAVGFAVACAVAVVAWWLIDRNILRMRNRWFTPARGRACGIVAYSLVGIGLVGGYILQSRGY